MTKRVYLAGPMTGIPEFNFPAFDNAAEKLRGVGFHVISPAEMDREDGFDEKGKTGYEVLTDGQRQKFAANDIKALLEVDAIVLLPGWQQSTGATNESKVASWLGRQGYEFADDEHGFRLLKINLTEKWSSVKVAEEPTNAVELAQYINDRATILLGAEKLVNGDRNVQYGDPRADFKRTADMWTAFLGVNVEPYQVAAMMALLKLSRIAWTPNKQDSWMDLAGYAACGYDARPEAMGGEA